MFNKDRFNNLYSSLFNTINVWSSDDFSSTKVLNTCILSKLAYIHIAEFEKEDIKRSKIVPSKTFQYLLLHTRKSDFNLRDLFEENVDIFIIENENYIVLGITIQNVLFISVRGTSDKFYNILKPNNDWRINFNVKKIKVKRKVIEYEYHNGFYNECHKILGKIKEEHCRLEKKYNDGIKLVFTGHSLGGAIAALLYLEWGCADKECYTFGMPRFAQINPYYQTNDFCDVFCQHRIHHVLHEYDIVPFLPPKRFDSTSILIEFSITKNGELKPIKKRDKKGLFSSMYASTKIKEVHLIEKYKSSIETLYPFTDL